MVTATYTGNGPLDGYSSNLPLTGVEIMQTTYYDDYAFLSRLSGEEKTAATYASRSGYPAKTSFTKGLPTGSVVHSLGSRIGSVVSASYYDSEGRISSTRSTNHLGGTEVTHTSYSFTSNPTKEYHRHTAPGRKPLTEEHGYSYDHADRLVSERISVNGGTATETSRHEYDELGRIGKTTLGNGYSQIHSYNLRGWLTAISGSMFSETMAYNATVDGLTPQVPSYSGNIAAMRWKSNGMQRGSQLRYDKLGRLTESSYGEGSTLSSNKGRFSERFTYDMMGNVLTVVRNGKISSTRYGCVDNLTLQYDGNQLRKVTDTGSDGTFAGAFDFDDGADEDVEYEYDRNGNMVKDLNKGISLIEYNCLNLPEKVEMKHHVNSSWVNYGYDGMGRKLYAEYSESLLKSAMPQSSVMDRLQAIYGGSVASSSASSSTSSSSSASGSSGTVSSGQSAASSVTKSTVSSTVVKKLDLTSEKLGKSIDRNATTLVSRHNTSRTDYCGNVVYEDSVCRLLFPQGYFTFDETTGKAVPHYFLKDHLGSVRVVMAADGTAEQVNHYYAFGGLMGDSSGGDVQKYKYNGKELDRFLNWDMLDYGARWMDGKLQQWPTVDPLAEKDPGISPYVYCKNDPVNAIDPDGRDVRPADSITYQIILNTLPQEDQKYVQLTSSGYIDKQLLNAHVSESGNYHALSVLVNCSMIVNVTSLEETEYINNGIKETESFMPVDVDEDFKDTGFASLIGNTTGEFGNLGVTYLPTRGNEKGKAPLDNNSIHININPSLSALGAAETFSHEGYGHAYIYVKSNGDRKLATHNFLKGGKEGNSLLIQNSLRARKETVKNMMR